MHWDTSAMGLEVDGALPDVETFDWSSLDLDGTFSAPGDYSDQIVEEPALQPLLGDTSNSGKKTAIHGTNDNGTVIAKSVVRKPQVRQKQDEKTTSSLERRRAQVRLAQRAYREREKGLVTSLRQDVDDLRARLLGMQSIADDWFRLISSMPTLSEETKQLVERLWKNESCHRLSLPSNIIGNNLAVNHDRRTRSTNQFKNSATYPTPFSLRLRIDTLKGAHRLISDPGTPCTILVDKFRNCIFVSTREEIKQRLEILINGSDDVPEPPRYTLSQPTNEHWLSESSIHNPKIDKPDNLREDDTYIDPSGVQKYLAGKGLALDQTSSYAEFSAKPSIMEGSSLSKRLTVFDELCQNQKVMVNINKLLRAIDNCMELELAARMVCRWTGPGILTSGIDEAVQSTLLAGG
ncbi:hypothetical protein PV08_06146 [Exophiala spinifera]|uniref:BZIP domain-containing protein n=1 Tax=Exophiala spinifera TaxID=91928 RepID=A0A0D2BBV8_9EURO|nr:uncharacterized protein PV08_06146 [Exophiala spinifera]KIW16095.1 hypothetical protein PV08_06146 [Exophiala spinifera]